MHYDYTIDYVPGMDITHADALSRMKFDNYKAGEQDEEVVTRKVINCVNMAYESVVLDPAQAVKAELRNDSLIQRLCKE